MQQADYNSSVINRTPAVFLSSEQLPTPLQRTVNTVFDELLVVVHGFISLLTDFLFSNKTDIDLFKKYLYYIPLPCLELKQ